MPALALFCQLYTLIHGPTDQIVSILQFWMLVAVLSSDTLSQPVELIKHTVDLNTELLALSCPLSFKLIQFLDKTISLLFILLSFLAYIPAFLSYVRGFVFMLLPNQAVPCRIAV